MEKIFNSVMGKIGSGLITHTGKQAEKKPGIEAEKLPEVRQDTIDVQFPSKRVKEEVTKDFVQGEGIIRSSKEVIEKSVPDLKPGQVAVQTSKLPASTVVEKEVTLKSGVTIHEDVGSHQVTISRNDGNGNPQTLAVLDDTSLELPRHKELITPFSGLLSNREDTTAKTGDVVIRNSNMKQIIKSDGTIVIEDQKNGALEPNQIPVPYGIFPGAMLPGAGSIFSKWHGDRYTITPEGALSAKHYTSGLAFSMVPGGLGSGLVCGYCGSVPNKPKIIEKQPQASINDDGVITSAKEPFLQSPREVHLKPFVSSEQVNSD